MQKKKGTASLLIVLCLLACSPLQAQQVFVRGAQDGQGFLRLHDGACYAVVPAALVAGSNDEIAIVGPFRFTSKGDLLQTAPPGFAIVGLQDDRLKCKPWEFPDAGPTFGTQRDGELSLRDEDGMLTSVPVTIRLQGDAPARVQTQDATLPLDPAMIGAALVQGEAVLGLLLTIDEAGEGIVVGLGDVARATAAFFGGDGVPDPPPRPVVLQEVTLGPFTFAFHGCRKTGADAVCTFTTLNHGKDQPLQVDVGDSRLIDASGAEYNASYASLGNVEGRHSVRNVLVAEIPLTMSITFGDLPVDHAALMEIVLWTEDENKLQLRDVALTD